MGLKRGKLARGSFHKEKDDEQAEDWVKRLVKSIKSKMVAARENWNDEKRQSNDGGRVFWIRKNSPQLSKDVGISVLPNRKGEHKCVDNTEGQNEDQPANQSAFRKEFRCVFRAGKQIVNQRRRYFRIVCVREGVTEIGQSEGGQYDGRQNERTEKNGREPLVI